ncbi:MarR family winged helix-turn-helix transcriptional regulator [Enterococcus thailandicus]|uniref:MarR family winged helix-turn-helix transcriptional regulator n=1 Tax=Enterococcus TaxID=1350 RepID=UPI0022E0009C|nr:MarR family transcriptional regulator [Enterococcus thailandicus]
MSLEEISHVLYQIKVADQKIIQIFEENIGLSLTRYELLTLLREKNPCSQNTLQSFLQINQGAVTRHLKLLETKGYVTRQRNPLNNREVVVTLTAKAEEKLSNCEREHTDMASILSPAFEPEEMSQLLVLLNKLNTQLSAIKTKEVE